VTTPAELKLYETLAKYPEDQPLPVNKELLDAFFAVGMERMREAMTVTPQWPAARVPDHYNCIVSFDEKW
jgi:hypothetical protein